MNKTSEDEGHVHLRSTTDHEDEGLPFRCTNVRFELQKSGTCSFTADIFEDVMINLIQNPNILSSQVYRADIFYDSLNDPDGIEFLNDQRAQPSLLQKALKSEIMPLKLDLIRQGITSQTTNFSRTFVRQFVPRNPVVDKKLLQTCHLLETCVDGDDTTSVIFLPHIDEDREEMPFYHPPVKALCFHWSRRNHAKDSVDVNADHNDTDTPMQYQVSIYAASPKKTPIQSLPDRFHRIMDNLIRIIIKHGHQNQLPGGFVKRVKHDVVIPRKRYQDTLVRLKLKYANALVSDWRENTDPAKHVFEDICIAAFLVELWVDMYGQDVRTASKGFPGFVDIGCGNGVLVNILIQEGYEGLGFDIRTRKSWEAYPPEVQAKLHQSIFTPAIYLDRARWTDPDTFIAPRNFIISNHADELTPWTPLVAYLYKCQFISIPCCSHDLGGQRCRFGQRPKSELQSWKCSDESTGQNAGGSSGQLDPPSANNPVRAAGRPASAYATLCDYVEHLARDVGFAVEREILRIPSTRNTAILGVKGMALDRTADQNSLEGLQDRLDRVSTIVEAELKMGLASAAAAWRERAQSLRNVKTPPTH